MELEMKLYWNVYKALVSTEEIINADFNPIYHFRDQMIPGAVIDIGCGPTSALLKFTTENDRGLIGLDNDADQLAQLEARMLEVTGTRHPALKLVNCDLLKARLPQGPYSIVVMYNILHFFSMQQCRAIMAKVDEHLTKGSLISVCVHSVKFWANDPANPDNNEYFKHYFTQEDLDGLFPSDKFEYLYKADIERHYSKKEREVEALWTEKVIEAYDITDEADQEDIRNQSRADHPSAELICVYRRK